MAVLERFWRPLAELRAVKQILGHPQAGLIGLMGSASTHSGVLVDQENAMMYAPALAATRLLATSIACLRIDVLRDGNQANPSRNHPVSRVLNRPPNMTTTAFMFRASRAAFQINQGNAYAEIIRTEAGQPVRLNPIRSDRVTVTLDRDGKPLYSVSNNQGTPTGIDADNMFHVTSDVSRDGVLGIGMVELIRESIGAGLAAEKYGGSFFGSGAQPEGVVKHPNRMDTEARKNFRKEWEEMHRGQRRVGILYEGMDWVQTSINPEEAQFLQTRKYDAEIMAMAYRVPQHMIGILDRSTNNNIEHQSKEFLRYSLFPWLKIWEQEIERKLLTERDRDGGVTAKFATEEFELTELATRTQSLNDRWMNGGLTVDERRSKEGMNPYNIEGVTDVPWLPLNMAPAPMVLAQAEALLKQNEEPPEEPPEQDEPPETDEEQDAEDDEMRSRLYAKTRDVLLHDLRRMMANEANAANRAAKKPGEFLAWLDRYDSEYYVKLLGAVAYSAEAWNEAGGDVAAKDIARRWCDESRRQLLGAADGDPNTFESRVAACVESWTARPLEATGGEAMQSDKPD